MRQVAGGMFALSGLLCSSTPHAISQPRRRSAYASIGTALGVVYAGDLITVFIFWEALALPPSDHLVSRIC